MAEIKEELVRKPPAPIKPKRSLLKSPLIPLTIVVVLGVTAVLAQMGYIVLPHINLNFGQSNVYTLPAIPIGVPYRHDFSDELIPLLGPESSPHIYSFYLGSGVGFPPMGLILGIDGVLKGTPTAKGTSKFQVCVKDVGGKSACRTYSLTVAPKPTPKPTPGPTCFTTSAQMGTPCHSVQNGIGTYGVIVPASCNCPSDTTYAQMDNVSPGGPYKICTCK